MIGAGYRSRVKILFSSLGTFGHTYPVLPLVRAAVEAGHEVVYATTERVHPAIAAAGAEPVAAGWDVRQAVAHQFGRPMRPQDLSPQEQERVSAISFGTVLPERFATDLAPLLERHKPDLVIREVLNLGAALAAAKAGVPALCHGLGRMDAVDLGPALHANVREVAAGLGVEPAGDGLLLGNPLLDICPPAWQRDLGDAERLPLRPVQHSDDVPVPEGVVGRDGKLVYLSLGTVFSDAPVLRGAIDGLAALDARVVVSAGPLVDVDALGELPANVSVHRWLPQGELLRHADLSVHHGGMGTTIGSAVGGAVHLVLPQGADQFGNAEAVVGSGLGRALVGADATVEAITGAARELLVDGERRAAAEAMAAEIAAMPSPEDVGAELGRRV